MHGYYFNQCIIKCIIREGFAARKLEYLAYFSPLIGEGETLFANLIDYELYELILLLNAVHDKRLSKVFYICMQ